jgi:hypothetical protein
MCIGIGIILKTLNVLLCTDLIDITYPNRSWQNITRLVQQVSAVFTQRDRKGGIRGKWGTALPQASSNEVSDKIRGGRIPFCASVVLSTRMSKVSWAAYKASSALAM